MAEHPLALGFVVFAWWSSTAAVMWTVWQPPETRVVAGRVLGVLAIVALVVVGVASRSSTAAAAYVSFGAALVLWGWHEMSFLSGQLTGPRREACPEDAAGWHRFRLATATVIHHELALAATIVCLVVVSWGAPNLVAQWTFLMLWLLRLSAKLNLFIGVPHVSAELLPPNLRYLEGYFRIRPGVSGALLVSLLASVAVTGALGMAMTSAEPGFAVTSLSLLAALALLGVLEHLFLAFPMQDARLWQWVLKGISSRRVSQELSPVVAGAKDQSNGSADA